MQVINIFNNLFVENLIVLLLVFLAFIADFITGVAKAIKNKNFQSSKLRSCVSKFLTYFAALIVGFITEILFHINSIFIISVFLITTEILSVFENAKVLGVKLPEEILKLFKRGSTDEQTK